MHNFKRSYKQVWSYTNDLPLIRTIPLPKSLLVKEKNCSYTFYRKPIQEKPEGIEFPVFSLDQDEGNV